MLKFHKFEVVLEPRERIIGGIPVVPEGADRADVYEKWARGQQVTQDPAFDKPLHEVLAGDPDMPVDRPTAIPSVDTGATATVVDPAVDPDVEDVPVEAVEGMRTGFRKDRLGIYLEARLLKSNLRESAQRLGFIKKVRGSRQVVQHDLYVQGVMGDQKLRLSRELNDERLLAGVPDPYEKGIWLQESDGIDSRPISVVTRQGPRTTIKRFEYVSAPLFICAHILILAEGIGDGLLAGSGEADMRLQTILEFGSWLGLGADRSQGEGMYNVVSFEKLVTG